MNNIKTKAASALGMVVMLVSLGAFTCAKQIKPEKIYVGTWLTSAANIQIRTKSGVMKYQFTPLTIPIKLHILGNGTADCKLGDVELKNLTLLKNPGNSDKTGIIYTIRCGEVGKLIEQDPSNRKELELWIKPLSKDNQLHVEIREMHLLDPFPIGEVIMSSN